MSDHPAHTCRLCQRAAYADLNVVQVCDVHYFSLLMFTINVIMLAAELWAMGFLYAHLSH